MSTSSILDFCSRKLTFGRLWLFLTFCFVTACVLGTVYLLPKLYASDTKLMLRTGNESRVFDPYHVNSAIERIASRNVLEKVIDELNLTAVLGGDMKAPAEIQREAAYQALSQMIRLRNSPNTSLIEVRVYSANPQLSTSIANKITEVARQTDGLQLSILEKASPSRKPVRPNVPLNIVVGSLVSVAAAVVLALLARLGLKALAPRPKAV